MKNKIIGDSLIINLANITSQGLLVLQGFIVLRFVDPNSYGIWMGLLILLRYGAYTHLGLSFGLMFQLPYYTGQQDALRVRQVEDTTFWSWTVLTFLFAAGVFGYYLLFDNLSGGPTLGIIIVSIMLLTEQQIAFLNRWNTNARKDFKLYSAISIFRSFFSFIVIVPLSYFFQVKGLMLGSLIVSAMVGLLWWIKTPYRPQLQVSFPVSIELLRVGFPNLLVMIGGTLVETIDRVLVLNLLGTVSLGYYAVTNMGGGSLYGLLSQSVGVILPHMVEETGQYRNNYAVFEKYLIKPTIYFSYLSALMVVFLVFVIPALVYMWLPEYAPGVLAFYLFVPGFFFLSLNLLAGNILNIILVAQKKSYWLVAIQFLAVFVEVLFGLLFIWIGWGIAGVALASTLSYVVYGFVVLSLTSRFVIQNRNDQRRLVLELFIPLAYGTAIVLIFLYLGNLVFPNQPLVRGFCQLVLGFICFLPPLFRLNRVYSLFNDVQSIPYISRVTSFFKKLTGK